MEISSIYVLEFVICKENGSTRLKMDKPSLREKLKPNSIMDQLILSNLLLEMLAGNIPIRRSIL